MLYFLLSVLCSISLADVVVTDDHGKLIAQSNNLVYLSGSIELPMAKVLTTALRNSIQKNGAVILIIDSVGGDIAAGKKIIRGLKKVERTKKLVCVVSGEAISAAFNILSHCSERYATRRSVGMFHHIELALYELLLHPEDKIRFTADKLRKEADRVDADEAPYTETNRKALSLSLEDYNLFAEKEHYWTAAALVEKKYLQGIVTITESK